MIWNILGSRQVVVALPAHMSSAVIRRFVGGVVDEQRDARSSRVVFDFGKLRFIEPDGIVVLCNLIEYLRRTNVTVVFTGHDADRECIRYLDDSQFFVRYLRRPLFAGAQPRATTVPLQLVGQEEFVSYLYNRVMPWIANIAQSEASALDSLRASLEEIFHNVNDHSGVKIGCTFAQYFPNKAEIQIAISDFGEGIPNLVRSVVPDLSDPECLRLACKEGFTTKSNVQNRGAGLPNLIRFVTSANSGTVLIASGYGELVASPKPSGTKITARTHDDFYPGSLVRVILREHNLRKLASTVQQEDFEW